MNSIMLIVEFEKGNILQPKPTISCRVYMIACDCFVHLADQLFFSLLDILPLNRPIGVNSIMLNVEFEEGNIS